MNAYVVAPSCDEAGTQDDWLPTIEKHQIAVNGYPADDNDGKKQIGHRFASIKDGDLVVIANGKNTSKSCYFAGFAEAKGDDALAKSIGARQVRRLRSFTSLKGEQIPFSSKCKHGNSPGPWIDACYMLDDGNPADKAVIDKVLLIIAKSQGERMIDEMIKLLEKAKQVVFTGAPGTGKTYLARQIAQKMILGKVVDDESALTEEERAKLEEQMGFVQFHPSYDYTDFVEGLRPVKSEDGKSLDFERRDGVFKAFCWRAAQKTDSNFDAVYKKFVDELLENHSEDNPLELKTDGQGASFYVYPNSNDSLNLMTGPSKKKQGSLTPEKIKTFLTDTPYKWWAGYYRGVLNHLRKKYGLSSEVRKEERPYVFIIDEINRGDVSKIFGELFFAIDKGYRGKTGGCPKTQYDNLIEPGESFYGGFYVPENVYIIGTMNDVDRNVESMDFAIRRRFTWLKVLPSERFEAMWTNIDEKLAALKEPARQRMEILNEAIKKVDGLGEAYQIGPAYFRGLESYLGSSDPFGDLWKFHLQPLVSEYLRGTPNAEERVKDLKSVYDNAETLGGVEQNQETPTPDAD